MSKINGETKEEMEAFYEKERLYLGDRYFVTIEKDKCLTLIRTFSIHYGLETPKITFNGRTRHLCYWAKPHLSFIGYELFLGVVIHEMAHYVENSLYKNRKHDDRLMGRILELWKLFDPEIVNSPIERGINYLPAAFEYYPAQQTLIKREN